MSNASIDQNDNPTWLVYNETTGLIEPVKVDPVTGALLLFGVSADANTPTTLINAKIDDNDHATQIAYNDTSGNLECMRCGTDGSLLVKIVS